METTQNRMGTAPVPKLLLVMGLPMVLSMMLQALYNIVDSYFVSAMPDTAEIVHMGDYAVGALTLAFPIQMLMVAIGVGTGVGINALLARSLGEGDRDKAGHIAGNAIFLGLCTYVVFLLFGLFGVKPYIASQTSDPIIFEMACSYLRICCVLSFGILMYMIYEKLLQATGRTMQATIAQIAGALTNIVLDPIVIFGLLGCPALGIEGAAYATVIGQCVSAVLDLIFHTHYNKRDFDTHLRYLRPKKHIILEIYAVGLPAILMQALMSFMTYGVNIIFDGVSTAAVTAYGMYYKIQQFVFFAAFGMNNAIIPLVGFNFGMRSKKRIDQGIRYGIGYTLIIMLIGMIGLQIFAQPLIDVFTLSDETRRLCVLAIRIITLGYLFAGANIAYQGIFQALGAGIHSLVLSLIRLIVVALPLAWVFTKLPNAETLIWAAFPIAEAVALVVALVLMHLVAKRQLKPIEAKKEQ